MPTRKYLSIRSLMDEKPKRIHAVDVDGKWLATRVRIQVNVEKNRDLRADTVPRLDRLHPKHRLAIGTESPAKENWPAFRELTRQKWTKETVVLRRPLDAQTHGQPTPNACCGIALMQNLAYEFGLENRVDLDDAFGVSCLSAVSPEACPCGLVPRG